MVNWARTIKTACITPFIGKEVYARKQSADMIWVSASSIDASQYEDAERERRDPMLLSLLMFVLLIGSYALLAALVRFSERIIRTR
jgi:hypothetical protein